MFSTLKPRPCEYCGQTFANSHVRNKHIHKYHEKEITRY